MIAPAKWERVRALFHEALERPAQGRAQFLRDQSGGDDELYREAESLLAAHGQADGFLSGSLITAEDTRTTIATLTSGSRVGTFEILELLGSGGMGHVYRARDTRLDRMVALKVLSTDVASDPNGRERFDREARLLSRATHPNICTLFDVTLSASRVATCRFWSWSCWKEKRSPRGCAVARY